jgi:hypothetical protein
MFFFHKGGDGYGIPVTELVKLLNQITCKKVFWYFDKMWEGRDIWADTVIPYVDHAFLTDGSYLRRRNFANAHYLNQGIGDENTTLGTPRPHLECGVAFTGSLYGERRKWAEALKEVYGDEFRHFNYSFDRNLYDLCASAKIFVAPLYPQDNFYWSSRVYMILGSGGFLIHPRLEGLKEEFTKDELVTYRNGQELKEKIDYYLTHEEERKKIQMAGYKKVIENYTYTKRIQTLLDICKL